MKHHDPCRWVWLRTLTISLASLSICHHANAQLKIDEELLSGIVQAKQDELKTRFLKNLVYANIKTTNNTTYNTMYDLVDILLTERNKTVLTDKLVHKTADYAITYGIAWAFLRNRCAACRSENGLQGFATTRDPWEELGEVYRMAQGIQQGRDSLMRGESSGDRRDKSRSKHRKNKRDYDKRLLTDLKAEKGPIWINDSTDFRIGLENWLLDEVYAELLDDKSFKAIGLFRKDLERGWQYDVDYNSFWDANRVTRRDSIKQELVGYLDDLRTLVTTAKDLSSVGAAVGLNQAADLKGLDLSSLKNRSVETDSSGALRVPSQENKQVKAVFKLFLKAVELYRDDVGQNSAVAKIADIITKYVIFDPEQNDPLARFGFSIDAEALILSLEDRFVGTSRSPTMNSWLNVRPFFTIGMNYGYFSSLDNAFEPDTTLGLRQIAWAGEKVGLKWHLWDWKYTRGQPAYEWFKFHGRYHRRLVRPRIPMVSRWYLSVYGSGLLYTIADLRTENTFKYPIVGVGTGLEFFNGMEANISLAQPMITNSTPAERARSMFLNVGFDIPIFEYIRAARVKGKN